MPNRSEILKQHLFDSVARPWQEILPASTVEAILSDAKVRYRNRLYTPMVTILAMVYQVLCADKSLSHTVKWLRKWLVMAGEAAPASATGGYSKARTRLPEIVLERLVSESGAALNPAILILDFCKHFEVKNVRREAVLRQQNDDFDLQRSSNRENHSHTENCCFEPGRVDSAPVVCGRPVKVFDGSTLLMSDSTANQKAYPQHGNQQPGCGFPIARIVVFFH